MFLLLSSILLYEFVCPKFEKNCALPIWVINNRSLQVLLYRFLCKLPPPICIGLLDQCVCLAFQKLSNCFPKLVAPPYILWQFMRSSCSVSTYQQGVLAGFVHSLPTILKCWGLPGPHLLLPRDSCAQDLSLLRTC